MIDHTAVNVSDYDAAKSFYSSAAGGKDNGEPGLRTHYHEHYYAAFVHDADGNNIEAVFQAPQ